MIAAAKMSPARTSAVGALLVALGPISMALYTPAMPTLVSFFGTDVATVKLTLTLYFLGFALAQLVCGPLSDAFGRRPVILGFITIYLVGSVAAVLAPTVEWLLVARAVQGTGAAAGVAISRAIVRDLYTGRESIQIMNLIGLMLAAGPALSPTIGGVTLDLLGWHAIFLVMVVYGLVIIGVVATSVPETHANPDPSHARPGPLARNYLSLLTDARFLRPAIVMGCTVGSLYTLATILPFVLITKVGLSPTQYGVGMLMQSGFFMLGSLAVRRLLRTVEAHRLVPIGLGFVACGGLLLPLSLGLLEPRFLTVMTPIGLLAFGIAFVMPSMMTESLAPFPHIAGAAAALGGFFQMGGGLAGSAVAAGLGDPIVALALIVPSMALIAVVVHLALKTRTSRMEEAVADRLIKPSTPPE